jgi:putative hemolysin
VEDIFFLYILALIVLIGFSAFFSGSEAALFSLSRNQLQRLENESAAGRSIAVLLSAPRNVLITILIGNLIVNVFSTSAVTSIAISIFGEKGVAIAFAFMSTLILVFGETFPKALALNRPRKFALLCAYPLRIFHFVFLPARVPISIFTSAIIEQFKKHFGGVNQFFSREELLTAINIGRREDQLGEFEYEILSNIIEFRDTTIKEIMTPSIEVFSLPIDTDKEELLEKIMKGNYSRIPIYGETTDDMRGVLHIKDAIGAAEEVSGGGIAELIRPVYYVHESMLIPELFDSLMKNNLHLAIVIDEYASFVGIVTVEDILEELVGEIHDAGEPRTSRYTLLDNRRIIVLGTMDIEEFNELFETNIMDEENETIAGYVMGATGKIPEEGETIDIGELKFHIISARPNRIKKMRVEKTCTSES